MKLNKTSLKKIIFSQEMFNIKIINKLKLKIFQNKYILKGMFL